MNLIAVAKGDHVNKTIVIDNDCQIRLPEEMREALNLHPGDELLMQLEGEKLEREGGRILNIKY
jgi:bifunctional DNA-binding transcriptional regulator/antitoxin component of YhaV-PrlF toxin-antitoxin module